MLEKNNLMFNQFLKDIKNLIKNNKLSNNKISKNILNLGLDSDFVDANIKYFREQYESGYKPENILEQIETDIYDLYLKLDDMSDDYIINEADNRSLSHHFLDTIDTYDLEEELDTRHDSSYKNINSLTRDEFLKNLD